MREALVPMESTSALKNVFIIGVVKTTNGSDNVMLINVLIFRHHMHFDYNF